MRYRYVLVGYTRDVTEQGTPIALVKRRVDGQQSPGAATFLMATYWRAIVDQDDLLYVELTLNELRDMPADLCLDILSDLSVGCLRTNDAGVCDADLLPALG